MSDYIRFKPNIVKTKFGLNLKSSKKARVKARDLVCYWSVVELGMSKVDVARRFDITPAAVSYSVQRGKKRAKKEGYQLET